MTKTVLTSTGEVIDALGGNVALADMLTLKNHQAVSNWRRYVNFPPRTYVAMQEGLAEVGKTAPASLWGMIERRSRSRKAA
jgi:hypothetical protein